MASPAETVNSEHPSEQKSFTEHLDDAEKDNQEVKKAKVNTKCLVILGMV